MIILGVESSCDETAAAVLRDGILLANVVDSQIEAHRPYGGVVPELASRHHLENIFPVVREALTKAGIGLNEVEGLAVTQGPGLIGSLLVGFSFVKALSFALKIPYVGVDHLSGHLASVFLAPDPPRYPFTALVASGGHSSIFAVAAPRQIQLLGRSRDDAAGEAFDKVAKLLGLPYPGGPIVSEMARQGDRKAIPFPRAWLEPESLDFSFSGLKTAVANYVNRARQNQQELSLPDICASFQEAVVEVLVEKAIRAAQRDNGHSLVLTGGVAANPRLREVMQQRATQKGLLLYMPPPEFCTDNAAMIAMAGEQIFRQEANLRYDTDVYSRSAILHP